MAVEDGAVLGRLLGLFSRRIEGCDRSGLPSLLREYQELRKDRTTTVVKTATGLRELYHMVDGAQQQERDRLLGTHDWWDESGSFPWVFADWGHLNGLYGFDALKSADDAFVRWYGDGSAVGA